MARVMQQPVYFRKAIEADFPEWLRMRKLLWPEASYDELRDREHLLKADNFACFFALLTYLDSALKLS